MARSINIQPIIEEIQSSLEIPSYSEHDKGFDDGLKYVLDLIENAPTLTPPNELMEALEAINNAAVAYIEGGPYENDLPGMEFALKIDRLSRDFVRPPEGEEDT